MTPDEYCQKKISVGSDYFFSLLFLPGRMRRALIPLFAFYHEIDDIKNECSDRGVATAKFSWWRQELENTFSGKPHHPVGKALLPVINQYRLDAFALAAFIEGMCRPNQGNQFVTFEELERHLLQTESAFIRSVLAILGQTNTGSNKFADLLGMALGLTAIIQHVGRDARNKLIYFPTEFQIRFQVSEQDIFTCVENNQFTSLMSFLGKRNVAYYDELDEILPAAERNIYLPLLIRAQIAKAALNEIRKDGYRMLSRRIMLPPMRKFWLAWRVRYKIGKYPG